MLDFLERHLSFVYWNVSFVRYPLYLTWFMERGSLRSAVLMRQIKLRSLYKRGKNAAWSQMDSGSQSGCGAYFLAHFFCRRLELHVTDITP